MSRLGHSLQTATRALRDGADDELIVAALIHDVGDELAPYNHSEVAAGIIRPYVRPEVTWIVEQHGLFQSYYYAHYAGRDRNAREKFRGHPWYQACKDFAPIGINAHSTPAIRQSHSRPLSRGYARSSAGRRTIRAYVDAQALSGRSAFSHLRVEQRRRSLRRMR